MVFHGSRDPRPQQAVDDLVAIVQQLAPTVLVSNGALELASQPLHQQIEQFAATALNQGYSSLNVLPLFLLPGVHVTGDIPSELAIAQQSCPQMPIALKPYLGSHPQISTLLMTNAPPNAAKLLVSHGSRRVEGNQRVEAIAADIGATPAYWSTPPDLETQTMTLVGAGWEHIVILPYFLFEGGITDAIAQRVSQLTQTLPHTAIRLERPLGVCPALVKLVIELLGENPYGLAQL